MQGDANVSNAKESDGRLCCIHDAAARIGGAERAVQGAWEGGPCHRPAAARSGVAGCRSNMEWGETSGRGALRAPGARSAACIGSAKRVAISHARRRKASLVWLACLLAACLCAAGCAGAQGASGASGASAGAGASGAAEGVAAYWEGHEIYEDDVTAYTQEFREANGLADDASWAVYLQDNDLTGKTWREQVIRTKADEVLVREKADELGVSADEDAVAERVRAMREQAGIAEDDDAAWSEYLAESGQTPEGLEESLRFSSLEQQLFSHELELSSELKDEMCDDYIHLFLADQVVRHYYALGFALDDKQGALDLIEELSGLEGDELKRRFVELCEQRAGEDGQAGAASELDAGSLGWDFLYNGDAIDPKRALRKAKLAAGELYSKPLKGTDQYRVVVCMEREELEGDAPYENIGSESLRALIADLALTTQWTALIQDYLNDLEQAAGVQVVYMPEGLPYDLVE